MARKWPAFITRDLSGTKEGDAEMQRRWETYDREMKALIATGTVYQDDDGWWFDKATNEIIGPDPEIERPLTDEEIANAKPFREVFPDLAASIDRAKRGRPPLEHPKKHINIRLDADLVDRLKADGPGWQSRANDLLRKAVGM